ncbi:MULTISPECIES: substrate-binding domain-containing protein [Aerococcus]|uniref:Extracellular solute-binding protein n=1 Tax=Aerococcus tenax TaxID=3078812 RepID=A0A5N1BHX2_9LACT|nr:MULTISPECIES: substrate-binding domain-containing protein [Aerococcus]KAA9239737.1 extracellular solute-binding protein [Aerococcus urinae]MCY3035478.1 extracellular solute-binding protein [Aerococcus sp. Group 2]MCY3038900.1 extracellular solute-binding protein [Aerococcus sp. Group 2]MCY3041055.1 extracellular solute-binding protein [Aerococcus sp. Group 2]MCY3042293.1 extracellular solute-binding protein [Aerococcus sp. Group 2]
MALKFKPLGKLVMALGVTATLAACGNGGSEGSNTADGGSESAGDFSGTINVTTREEGSGTRDAFQEIIDFEEPVASALVQNGTDQVLSYVAGDTYSIGYISLGSMNDTVKALKIDGVEATEENVANDSYKIARPFNIVYPGELEGAAKDFHDFIFSKEGQDIVLENGYVPVKSDAEAYSGDGSASGTINIAGSTSVGPVMEKLKEAYEEKNPNVQINITQNGSGAGVTGAQEGTADIGMASRELKEDETGVTAEAIAKDGIAVIVNKENPTDDLSVDQIRGIYTGEILDWSELNQ